MRVIQLGKLLADLIDHREVESRYVYTSQHCRSHIFRAGVRGKAFLRAGGKTRPRWHRPDAVGIDRPMIAQFGICFAHMIVGYTPDRRRP